MTQEEKAKRYDEALEKSKRLYEQGTITESLAYIFPELKESEEEDEKIRKEIIAFLKYYHTGQGNSVVYDDNWIAWLEKQVQKPQGKSALEAIKEERVDNANKVEPKDYSSIDPHYFKPADKVKPKFKVGDKIQYLKGHGTIMTIEKIENGVYIFGNNLGHTTIESGNKWHLVNLIEQTPAWSEEDDNCLSTIIAEFSKCAGKSVSKDEWMRCNDWLNSLRDRVQPQPKLSEEDEIMIKVLNSIIRYIVEIVDKDALERFGTNSEELFSWLKSLRPQSTWKPSDEQMVAVQEAMNIVGILTITGSKINSLYQDLKKLKE